MLFHMGRIGMLPRLVGRSHPRFKTPYVALLTYFVFNVVCLLVWSAFVSGGINVYGQVATIGSIPLILIYMTVNLAAIAYVVRGGKLYRNPAVGILVAILGVASMAYPLWLLIQPGQASPFKYFPWVILGCAVIAAIYSAGRLKGSTDLADQYDALLDTDVLESVAE
jgi:amino acid transporter